MAQFLTSLSSVLFYNRQSSHPDFFPISPFLVVGDPLSPIRLSLLSQRSPSIVVDYLAVPWPTLTNPLLHSVTCLDKPWFLSPLPPIFLVIDHPLQLGISLIDSLLQLLITSPCIGISLTNRLLHSAIPSPPLGLSPLSHESYFPVDDHLIVPWSISHLSSSSIAHLPTTPLSLSPLTSRQFPCLSYNPLLLLAITLPHLGFSLLSNLIGNHLVAPSAFSHRSSSIVGVPPIEPWSLSPLSPILLCS